MNVRYDSILSAFSVPAWEELAPTFASERMNDTPRENEARRERGIEMEPRQNQDEPDHAA